MSDDQDPHEFGKVGEFLTTWFGEDFGELIGFMLGSLLIFLVIYLLLSLI